MVLFYHFSGRRSVTKYLLELADNLGGADGKVFSRTFKQWFLFQIIINLRK